MGHVCRLIFCHLKLNRNTVERFDYFFLLYDVNMNLSFHLYRYHLYCHQQERLVLHHHLPLCYLLFSISIARILIVNNLVMVLSIMSTEWKYKPKNDPCKIIIFYKEKSPRSIDCNFLCQYRRKFFLSECRYSKIVEWTIFNKIFGVENIGMKSPVLL